MIDEDKYNKGVIAVADLLIINTKNGNIIDIDATKTLVKLFEVNITNKKLYDSVQNLITSTLNITDVVKEKDNIQKFVNDVITFLKNNDYVLMTDFYVFTLTEKGKLCKELKGHENYNNHRQTEINQVKKQQRFNEILLWLTGISIFISLCSLYVNIHSVFCTKDTYSIIKTSTNDTINKQKEKELLMYKIKKD